MVCGYVAIEEDEENEELKKERNEEIFSVETKNRANVELNHSLIHQLCINDTWFLAHGSRLMPQGSWLMAKKKFALGPGPGVTSAKFNPLINQLINSSILYNKKFITGIRKPKRQKKSLACSIKTNEKL